MFHCRPDPCAFIIADRYVKTDAECACISTIVPREKHRRWLKSCLKDTQFYPCAEYIASKEELQ
jgi:hypothetical protein